MDQASAQAMVLDVLQKASSQNSEVLKPAEAKLSEWEGQPEFYSVLLRIATNHSIDGYVRLMAVLYLKSGVDKYWRKNAPNEISDEEKRHIRQTLISSFGEPINQIALQLGVLIAKIARFDCPREWPELIPTLLQAVESNNPLIQNRALLVLHHVVKALSSKRLAGDRKVFQELSSSIYAFILNLWNNFTEYFVNNIGHEVATEIITENLEKALLCLRILRKLTTFGFHKLHENKDCICFLNMIFERAKSSLECRKQLRGRGLYVLELSEKFIIHLTKVLLNVLDMHPQSYINFIRPTLEFTFYYLFTSEGAQFTYERIIIQCFNLIKGILLCPEYKLAKIPELTKDSAQEAHQFKISFFQTSVLTDMCRKIVYHYMLLKSDDLELWDADPETFANDEVGESWKYSLRPCVETVFVTLFHEFNEILAPVLVEMIAETSPTVHVNDLNGILKKDAVYNAVGSVAYDLFLEIDFDQWFTNTLIQELKVKDPNYRIIRRRVSRLIGNWTGIKLSSDLRPLLYECIVDLLSPDEDMAVRLTTSTTLRHAIDDFEFNAQQFRPYTDVIFNLLFTLLKETSECETKMHVLNVMSLMVESVGQTIQPHSDALIHYLPLLWKESEEHNMLRCAIVSILVQLVKALGPACAELNPFLLSIVQLGTDINQNAIVYMLEESLELWLTILEKSSTMTPELMHLFENMPNLLEYTENLECLLIICLAHMLIAPEMVMKTQGVKVMKVCDSIMGDLRFDGIMLLMRLVENYIRASPTVGCEAVKVILPRIFESIYQSESTAMILSMYLSIVARVLLSSHAIFTEIIGIVARKENKSEEEVLASIMDVWIAKMPNVAHIENRKLLGLALANLLTTRSSTIWARFEGILERIVEVLHDITLPDENGEMIDTLVLTEGQSPSHLPWETDDYETDHDQRKKQLILTDPVHNIVLKDYFQSQMLELQRQMGEEIFKNTFVFDVMFQIRNLKLL